MLAPVALFVYNRPLHTRRTIEALLRSPLAEFSDLLIFADGPKASRPDESLLEVRRYLPTITGFRSIRVIERVENVGLAASIIQGVTQVCNEYGRVIVLEDDLVTGVHFLRYMNEALAMYGDSERVASVHGYCYPVGVELPETFFLRGADCWGWATWSRAWAHFEADGKQLLSRLLQNDLTRTFDLDGAYGFTRMLRDQIAGRNDSWAIRWHASCFLRDQLTLYPGRSLVRNIGNDNSGRHSRRTDRFDVRDVDVDVRVGGIEVRENAEARHAFVEFLRPSPIHRLGRLLVRAVGL